MKLSLELKGMILGIVAGLAAIGVAFAAAEMFQPEPAAASGAGRYGLSRWAARNAVHASQ